MPESTFERGSGVGLERLAAVIQRITRERRPERLALAALDAAMAATGARGGRIVGPVGGGRSGQLALEGTAPTGTNALLTPLEGTEGRIGHIEVWGVDADAETLAALQMVAAQCAVALEVLRLTRARSDDRRRSRRLAIAAEGLRAATDAPTAISLALADARAVTRAPAAVLVAAGAARLEAAACDGVDPLSEEELTALVSPELRPTIAEGEGWSGALAADHPLRARGFRSAAVAGVGPRAALGFLAVLAAADDAFSGDDLDALIQLGGHVGTALTTVVLQREVRELGTVDPLTRFFNARYFHTRLDQECQRARRTGASISVAVMSLDGLSDLRAGGRASSGDAAIQALSVRMAARLRAMDVGCRVSEDELVAILPEVEGIDAFRVGERLRASLRDDAVLAGAFTLSVGVASFPEQAAGPEELFENARHAMTWARLHGGDGTFLYHRDAAAILEAEEQRRNADEESLLATLLALVEGIDARDPRAAGHSGNVGRLSALIAAEMGFPAVHAERVGLAGRLHDLGKAGMRREIVARGGPLPDEDRDELRRHPEIGARMLSGCALEDMGPWVRHHHERVDGTGYPDGLAGAAIPMEARIIAVADRFDRLIRGEADGGPVTQDVVMTAIHTDAGPGLDAGAVAALAALVRRGAAFPTAADGAP